MKKSKGNIQIRYWKRFLTDPYFRDRNRYMKAIAREACIFHQDTWTKMRFFGPVTIIVDYIDPWLGLFCIIYFSLTDVLDGMVARYKKEANDKEGGLLDAWADKVFIIPNIWIWGRDFVGNVVFCVLVFIEFFGNMIIGALSWNKKEEEKKALFRHAFVGKIKMCLQVILSIFFWYARHFSPGWVFWPEIFSYAMNLVILFATLSIVVKLNNNLK